MSRSGFEDIMIKIEEKVDIIKQNKSLLVDAAAMCINDRSCIGGSGSLRATVRTENKLILDNPAIRVLGVNSSMQVMLFILRYGVTVKLNWSEYLKDLSDVLLHR